MLWRMRIDPDLTLLPPDVAMAAQLARKNEALVIPDKKTHGVQVNLRNDWLDQESLKDELRASGFLPCREDAHIWSFPPCACSIKWPIPLVPAAQELSIDRQFDAIVIPEQQLFFAMPHTERPDAEDVPVGLEFRPRFARTWVDVVETLTHALCYAANCKIVTPNNSWLQDRFFNPPFGLSSPRSSPDVTRTHFLRIPQHPPGPLRVQISVDHIVIPQRPEWPPNALREVRVLLSMLAYGSPKRPA